MPGVVGGGEEARAVKGGSAGRVAHGESRPPSPDEQHHHARERRTWRMVSKLNVRPFHSVNSPEVEPVRMRLASGVNCAARRVPRDEVGTRFSVRALFTWTVREVQFESRRTVTTLTGHRSLLVDVWA